MIKAFKDIGEYYLQKNGYYDTDDENKKMKIFLVSQAIKPRDDWGRELVINLNTKNKTFEFKQGREINKDMQEELFAFGVSAPRDKRKFLSTNSLEGHIAYTINDTISYITDKKLLFMDEYLNIFNMLKNDFCVQGDIKKGTKVNKVNYLNYKLLKKEQKDIFTNCLEEKKSNSKSRDVYLNDIYKDFIFKIYPDYKEKKIRITTLLINNINLIDKYYSEYNKLLVDDFLNNKSKIKKETYCSICNKLSNKIFDNIPFNIYGSTNPKYFENLNSSNSYKSFSLCKDCYIKSSTGFKLIENDFKTKYLWGSDEVLLIPNNNNKDVFDYEGAYKFILEKFKSNNKDVLEKYKEIYIKGVRKNLTFDLLFYLKNKQQISVIKHLSYLEFKKIDNLFKIFDDYNSIYDSLILKISLSDIYWLLFPNKNIRQDVKPELYRKEMIDFYSAILNYQPISYNELIRNFMKIYHKVYNNKSNENKKHIDEPLRMNILMTILYEYTTVKGGNKMQGNSITKITDEEYIKFFEIHSDIYKDNNFRQGLFLIGCLINRILRVQGDKSSTFINKVNFDGIPKRRIFPLINDIKNYFKIYKKDIYDSPELWAQTLDRLQGIEKSDLNKDEIIFYILSGISYSQYIGLKKYKDKQLNKKEGD